MRILIVGGSGFIGSSLANFLNSRDHETVVSGYSRRADIQLDARSISKLSNFFKNQSFDLVINLAGAFRGNLDINTCSSMNIVDAMHLSGKNSRFLHVASATENGKGASTSRESEYSFTKEIGSANFQSALDRTCSIGMTVVLHNTYGVDQPKDRFIAACVESFRNSERVILNYQNRIRDFAFQPDVNLAFAFAIKDLLSESTTGHIVKEIGTAVGVTLLEAALVIAGKFDLDLNQIESNPLSPVDPHPTRTAANDPLITYLCKTSLSDGIEKIVSARS